MRRIVRKSFVRCTFTRTNRGPMPESIHLFLRNILSLHCGEENADDIWHAIFPVANEHASNHLGILNILLEVFWKLLFDKCNIHLVILAHFNGYMQCSRAIFCSTDSISESSLGAHPVGGIKDGSSKIPTGIDIESQLLPVTKVKMQNYIPPWSQMT